MSKLPVIKAPTATFTLPISQTKIIYRPFTVKEEKILLIAFESKDAKDIVQGFKQVITNCIINRDQVNLGSLPMFDLEVLFILLRIASVSNISELKFTDSEDNKVYTVNVDLRNLVDETVARVVDIPSTVMITDTLGVKIQPPTLDMFENDDIQDASDPEEVLKLLGRMITMVYDTTKSEDDDTDAGIWKLSEFSDDEVKEFLESFTPEAMQSLFNYVDKMPRLVKTVSFRNSRGTERSITLEGLSDFFPSS